MEVQLLAKDIPTMVLCKKCTLDELLLPKKVHDYYQDYGVQLLETPLKDSVPANELNSIKNYFIQYYDPQLEKMTFHNRIEWLCKQTKKWQAEASIDCMDRY